MIIFNTNVNTSVYVVKLNTMINMTGISLCMNTFVKFHIVNLYIKYQYDFIY